MALSVQDPSDAVNALAADWPIVEALMGGTRAMRAAREAYLPKWPNEALAAYEARVSTATLYPALRRTIEVMAGKPFAKELTLSQDAPDTLRAYCDNVDLEGRNLHAFSAGVLHEALAYGLCGVLVDMPVEKATPKGDGVTVVKDEKAAGHRPYLSMYGHRSILGWRTQRHGGTVRLTQLRLRETTEDEDGEYGTETVERVRVLYPGRWEVWRRGTGTGASGNTYTLEDSGTASLPYIPFIPFYGEYRGFMNGVSPLLDLAHQNVKHWQSQSDQDTILRVARVPILAVSGIEDDVEITVGASSAIKLPTGAEMKFVEHGGAAIAAGAQALRDLEQQMIQTGAELLIQSAANRTATEASNEAEGNKSQLLRIVENFEDSLDRVLQCMAEWIGEAEGGNVSLFKDFTAATLNDATASVILELQGRGLVTKATALREMQRRGTLSPDVEVDSEIEAAEQEAPALATAPPDDPGAGE